jgi:type IV secretory pathway component VirB8
MDLAHNAEEVADQLDELVKPAREPENAVLVDNARVVRWAGPAFVLFSLILLPWIVYLAYSLPSRQVSADSDIAWAGFDVMLLIALASTGYFALRRSRYLATAAAAAATLLVVDAWFDVVTTLPGQRLEPVALAVLVELPLASVCVWLSLHTQQVAERRLVLLLRRGPKGAARER